MTAEVLPVSVVVPTYRRPGLLARCLAALVAQDIDPSCFEVIVVDDEPDPAVERIVRMQAAAHALPVETGPSAGSAAATAIEASPAPAVRYIAMPRNRGPAAARNAGWRAARGEVVAFTDDDCIPQPGWLAAGLEAMRDASGATGRIVVPRPESPTDYEAMTGRLERVRFATANCFYRRAALERTGGFDERFPTAWREDSDLFFTLLEAGERLVDAPRAVVVHPVRVAPWGVSVREQRKSQFNALLYAKHPTLYRRDVQSRPPLLYYAILASAVVAIAGAVTRMPLVAGAGALGWLVQTAWFARRRLRGTSHAPAHVIEMLATSAVIPPLSVYWRLRGALRYRTWFL